MTLGQGIVEGLRGGRSTAVAAVHLWLAALALAGIASAPFAVAVHEALDGHPGAARLVADGGASVLDELSRTSGGIVGLAPPASLLLVALGIPIALFLLGGTYFLAAGGGERPVRAFWTAGATRCVPFLGVAAATGAYGVLVAVACFLAILPVQSLLSHPLGPLSYRLGVAACVGIALAGVLHLRTVLGFALACREVAPVPGVWRPFREGLRIAWRRTSASHAVSLVFLAAGASAALLGGFLADRLGWGSAGSAVSAQLGWLALAWLRASEVRARVALAAAWTPRPPAPPRDEASDLAIGACIGSASGEPLLPDGLGEGSHLVEEQR